MSDAGEAGADTADAAGSDGAANAVAAPAAAEAPGAAARAWGGWVVLSAVVGVGLGMVWALVAPRVEFRVSAGEFFRVSAQPEQYFVADLVLGVMLAVAGAVLAGVWWRRGQQQPMASLLGLLTGGVVAAAVAVLVGQGLTGGPVTADGLADGVVVRAGLEFRSWAMVVWWPTLAAVLFAVVLAGSTGTEPSTPARGTPVPDADAAAPQSPDADAAAPQPPPDAPAPQSSAPAEVSPADAEVSPGGRSAPSAPTSP